MILVSPAEPKSIKLLMRDKGIVDGLPEKYGADFLFAAQGEWVAVQRKTMDDFLASLEDGRLAQEIPLLRQAAFAVVLLEGWPQFTTDGYLLDKFRKHYTREQIRNALRSLYWAHGLGVERTESPEDTVAAVLELRRWLSKSEHRSLLTRPKHLVGTWGIKTSREWGIWVLQGFPGIGPTLAAAIFDHFGEVPLVWATTLQELMEIPGIGKKRAVELWKALGG